MGMLARIIKISPAFQVAIALQDSLHVGNGLIGGRQLYRNSKPVLAHTRFIVVSNAISLLVNSKDVEHWG
jgi:hypothetical protein